ncbi:hypothetical protein PgNI_05374 [Pyricularia grisea]|uniref:Uncharacterized protein n=1 Tax=Pyricularia grisea TaxID=148305 RepID=A0A6P8B599_PYRGI|nr:hypothetical protein PgNI_05374 [Pyricularia grisea]TLD10516.1 hypothetical protein PgNI_05374 [Pyricularia grisea]
MQIQGLFAIIAASAALFPTIYAASDPYFSPPSESQKCFYTIYRVESINGEKVLVREGVDHSYTGWDAEIKKINVHFDKECNPQYQSSDSSRWVFFKGVRKERHIYPDRLTGKKR